MYPLIDVPKSLASLSGWPPHPHLFQDFPPFSQPESTPMPCLVSTSSVKPLLTTPAEEISHFSVPRMLDRTTGHYRY